MTLQAALLGDFLIFGRLGAKTNTNQCQDSGYFKNHLVEGGGPAKIELYEYNQNK